MNKVIKHLKKATALQYKFPLVGFFLVLFSLVFINTFHEKYPDEFDNILGGWYIIHGRLPYIGFFTHHGPIAYFIAAVVAIFSGQSFIKFRIVYSLFLFGFLTYTYILLRQRWGELKSKFYLVFLGMLALGSTYYWFHMLLADNISALVFLPVFAILLLRTVHKEPLTKADYIISSVLLFVGLLSSLTYIYLALGYYLYLAYYYFKSNNWKFSFLEMVKISGILVAPYIVFGVYLLITGSIKDYLYQSLVFNEKYYIYNIPRRADGSLVNPIRAGVFLVHEFLNNYITLLVQVRDLNFSYPLNITFALGNLVMLYYLVLKRKYAFGIFLFWILVFANSRSNPLTSAVRDYQSAVYIFISVFNIIFVLPALYKDISGKDTVPGEKVLSGIFLGILGIYSLFCSVFILNHFNNTFYPKYMGQAPFIYNAPELAPYLNKITQDNDYMWVGPFEFEELFYMKGKLATKYHILNPGVGKSDKISAEQVADIKKTKPKYIWYNPNFYILGQKPGIYAEAFNEMIKNDYVSLYDYKDGNKKYVSLVPVTLHIDFEKFLYLRKENAQEMIQRLISANIIQEESVKK